MNSLDGVGVLGEGVGRLLRQLDGRARPLRRGSGQTAGRGDADPLAQQRARKPEPVGEGDRRLGDLLDRRPCVRCGRGRRRASPCGRIRRTRRCRRGRRRPGSTRRPKPHEQRCAATFSTADAAAQLCSTTSVPTVATQSSSSPMATDSSTGCTGVMLVTPVSRPSSAAGNNGSSNCTTTGVSSRRATSARWAAIPSASDPARSRSAPASVMARWPPGSSNWAASVIGPGA